MKYCAIIRQNENKSGKKKHSKEIEKYSQSFEIYIKRRRLQIFNNPD